jgi:hypothetical protein
MGESVQGPKVSALDMAPHPAEEFVCNVDKPGRDLTSMPPGCNDACAWRCSAPGCGHEWIVPLYVRTVSERGCSKCGHRKTGEDNSRPSPGESLAEVNPDLAAELVEVVNHAGWTAYDLLPFSNTNPVCGGARSVNPTACPPRLPRDLHRAGTLGT